MKGGNVQPTSILISLMGSLGDVARGLTLVEPLKNKFPQASISWLVEPKCAELVQLHPQIDKVIVYDRPAGLLGIVKLYRELKKLKFDLCLDLQRHLKSALFSRMSGAKRIIGFHRKDSKEFNWLFSTEQIAAFGEVLPKIEHYWKFLELLDIPSPSNAAVKLNLDKAESVFNKFSLHTHENYVVLVLGSSWSSKDWPISGFQRLITETWLQNPELKFVLSGGKEHAYLGQKLKLAFAEKSTNILNTCGMTSLADLCILIRQARAVVGPDSGPGHLAALQLVPFIGLFGPTDAGRTAPYGNKISIVSSKIGCSPCYRRKCPGLDKLCMRMLDPAVVSRELSAALE